MKSYSHYGEEVSYQVISNSYFKDELKKNGIEYVDLPILENVIRYEKDGVERFAYIVPEGGIDGYYEKIYIIHKIPMDMNWKKLADDIDEQRKGKPAAKMETKAHFLCVEAEKQVRSAEPQMEFSFDNMPDDEIDPVYFRLALINLGYSIEELMEMDRSDVNEDMLKAMLL